MGTSDRIRIAVLMGGQSPEHDVSLASGLRVVGGLDPQRYAVTPITIDRDGTWLVGHAPEPITLDAAEDGGPPREARARGEAQAERRAVHGALDELRRRRDLDVVFIALHGPGGEDGTIQGLLTLAGVPYTGSDVLASALAMDKVKTKELYHFHGIPVARHFVFQRRAFLEADAAERQALVDTALDDVGLPCVIKPVTQGSSVATHVVRARLEAAPALEDALRADSRAMVEAYLSGVEVTCSVLGGGPAEPAQALPLTEIRPQAGSSFFDYRAKYTKGACQEITPARIPDEVAVHVQDLAVRAHEALGCEGMSRTDFIVVGGKPFALETNTIPGLTETSLLPQAAAAAGIPFARLLDRLVDSALNRGRWQARA